MGIHFRLLAITAAAVALVACGNKSDNEESNIKAVPPLTAATLGTQTVLSAEEYLAQARYADTDRKNGAVQAQICRACHSFDDGGPNMIGPALYGFFGTGAGSRNRYDYSPVMRNANFVWTPRALGGWLAQPGRFLPGNRMVFAGVMRQSDRDDLVAYLLYVTSVSDSSENKQD